MKAYPTSPRCLVSAWYAAVTSVPFIILVEFRMSAIITCSAEQVELTSHKHVGRTDHDGEAV